MTTVLMRVNDPLRWLWEREAAAIVAARLASRPGRSDSAVLGNDSRDADAQPRTPRRVGVLGSGGVVDPSAVAPSSRRPAVRTAVTPVPVEPTAGRLTEPPGRAG